MPSDADAQSYIDAHTTALSGAGAAAARWTARQRGEEAEMMAGLVESQLLTLIVAVSGARNVLEVGTFTGVGTLALAAGLRDGGQVTTIEIDPDNAEIARGHVESSPWADRVNLLVGDATRTIATLPGPFDFVWLDAWKHDYPAYWQAIRAKLAPGAVVAADNVLRGGRVYDRSVQDPSIVAVRAFNDMVHADPDFNNLILDVGDGVLLAWRRLDG